MKLFDSRFWLRARSNSYSGQLSVIPYIHKKHKQLLHDNLDANKSFDTLPAIKANSGKIIAFPTLGAMCSDNGIVYEWRPKKIDSPTVNRYLFACTTCTYFKIDKKNNPQQSSLLDTTHIYNMPSASNHGTLRMVGGLINTPFARQINAKKLLTQ